MTTSDVEGRGSGKSKNKDNSRSPSGMTTRKTGDDDNKKCNGKSKCGGLSTAHQTMKAV
jgi:hypothetical protein